MKAAYFTAGILLCSALFAGGAGARELDSKLEKAAQKISEAAAARDLAGATLAVFPFQADDRLSKKRVNFAVSEILTRYLLKQGAFKVMERYQLEEVMKEQKLGASGAVDSRTAAEIGKLMGARLLVIGNVIKVGNSYQIIAKLVNSETGELLVSEISEVPVKTFEEDAANYLVLVPKTQTIGVFALWKYGIARAHNVPSFQYSVGPVRDPRNSNVTLSGMNGIGLRYWLLHDWMVEFSSVKLEKRTIAALKDTPSYIIRVSAKASDLMINRGFKISDTFRGFGGVGLSKIDVDTTGGAEDHIIVFVRKESLIYTPLVRLGIEWQPQARIGLGIFSSYSITNNSISQKIIYPPAQQDDIQMTVWKADLPRFVIESTLSIYF